MAGPAASALPGPCRPSCRTLEPIRGISSHPAPYACILFRDRNQGRGVRAAAAVEHLPAGTGSGRFPFRHLRRQRRKAVRLAADPEVLRTPGGRGSEAGPVPPVQLRQPQDQEAGTEALPSPDHQPLLLQDPHSIAAAPQPEPCSGSGRLLLLRFGEQRLGDPQLHQGLRHPPPLAGGQGPRRALQGGGDRDTGSLRLLPEPLLRRVQGGGPQGGQGVQALRGGGPLGVPSHYPASRALGPEGRDRLDPPGLLRLGAAPSGGAGADGAGQVRPHLRQVPLVHGGQRQRHHPGGGPGGSGSQDLPPAPPPADGRVRHPGQGGGKATPRRTPRGWPTRISSCGSPRS